MIPPKTLFILAAGLTALPLAGTAKEAAPEAKVETISKVTKVTVQVIPNMVKFDTTQFDVPAGASVELTFKNDCVMPHNLLILPTSAEPAVVAAVNALGAEGFQKDFVPDLPEILVASKLIPSKKSEVLKFKAPTEAGAYLFLCTFPGHWFTMRGVMQVRAKGEMVESAKRIVSNEVNVPDALKDSGVTHKPVGQLAKPLVMRTFLPDPGLEAAVFAHHGTGRPAVKYDPATRLDMFKKTVNPQTKETIEEPIMIAAEAGVPGAIAVSHGPEFSYAWDTTECRLLYAWRGGFLDMNPYWGKEPGTGRAHQYIPHLIGNLVYRASGPAPLATPGDPAPKFGGYRMVENSPEFFYQLGGRTIRERVIAKAEGGFELQVQVEGGAATWKIGEKDTAAVHAEVGANGQIRVQIRDRAEAPFQPAHSEASKKK